MDGGISDLKKLTELKNRYDCLLMIDEAHGIFGNNLAGIAERENLLEAGLGKSFASMGAFCPSSKTIIDYLINKADSFIFSTAIPPINVMRSDFLIEENFETVKEKSKKLNILINQAHEYLNDNGNSQIIPFIIGENKKTARTALKLRAKGYYVLPVRPAPANTSRLRLSLTADITIEEFKSAIDSAQGVLNEA